MPATASDRLRLRGRRLRRRLRRLAVPTTVRLRLTLLYGACFLIAGAALLAITYGLVAGDPLLKGRNVAVGDSTFKSVSPASSASVQGKGEALPLPLEGAGGTSIVSAAGPRPKQLTDELNQLKRSNQKQIHVIVKRANGALRQQRDVTLRTLLTRSAIALAIMALLSVGLGWLVAGRVLRPLRTMNSRARQITADSLHERLGLDGRQDELGELAGTFDELLARLQRAFDSQRRFVANASHELRTPLTLERAVLEVALADPDASTDSLRHACRRVLRSNAQQERLIDGLLTLARGQAGTATAEPVDLRQIADELVTLREHETPTLTWRTDLRPAVVRGDPTLLERLVANLLDNAAAYNAPIDGWIEAQTMRSGDRPTLRVANGGAVIAPERVEEIFEPFRRLEGERLANGRGLGLGLSIVRAIADASGATIDARPRAEGGLELTVSFPPAPQQPEPRRPPESAALRR